MGRSIAQLQVGESAQFSKTITETDVYLFAGITGDFNPAHMNAVEAKKGMFGRPVVHGMLAGSLFSTILGTSLPGTGTIYLGQELKFTKPVFFGDTLTATVTVTELFPEKNICKLETTCVNQDGVTVIRGFATVMPPKD